MYEGHDDLHHSCEGLNLMTKAKESLSKDDQPSCCDPKGREPKVIEYALVASESLG